MDKGVEFIVEGLLSTGPTPSSFYPDTINLNKKSNILEDTNNVLCIVVFWLLRIVSLKLSQSQWVGQGSAMCLEWLKANCYTEHFVCKIVNPFL